MTDESHTQTEGRWVPKTTLGKLGHIGFWIALFYLLTWGIAKLCEWLSP